MRPRVGRARDDGGGWRARPGLVAYWLLVVLLAATAAGADPVEASFDEVELLRARVESLAADPETPVFGARIATRRALQGFYERRGFRRAWTMPGASDDLLRAVRESERDGLDPQDYLLASLEQAHAAVSAGGGSLEQQIDFDLLQTDALARLLYHLIFGKVAPKTSDPHWNLTREIRDLDPAAFLEGVVGSGHVFERIEAEKPSNELYRSLRDELARQRELAAKGEAPTVPDGVKLELGSRGPRVAALRVRLGLDGATDTFDEATLERVKRLQASRGLDEDGVVGPATLAAVNLSAEERIRLIRVNLERMRWYLHGLDPTFVLVNIAGFRVYYLRDWKVVWTAPAIIGKPYRRTPVFRSEMTYLVLNPTWTVPPTILAKDILPAQRRDHGYLERKGIAVVDGNGRAVPTASVDWSRMRATRFPYKLVQRPGPTNALGRVKFMFPNSYAIYLHDTPSRELFAASERAFSSGCIRIAQPLELAALLLADQPEWSRAAIDEAVAAGKTRTVRLSRPVPILVTYATAWVDRDDTLQLRRDVYGLDEQVWQGLQSGFQLRR